MPTAFARALMRQLAVAFLLLLGSATDGRARTALHRHHGTQPGVAAASQSALLAARPVQRVRQHVDTAPAPLLASEASLRDRPVQFAPALTRHSASSRSYERTSAQGARPPPFQA